MSEFDVIIVGAGAGGGMAAWVLATRGFRVALIEKGRNPYPTLTDEVLRGSHFGDDELKRARAFAFHDFFAEPRSFRASSSDPAKSLPVQGLGVAVGGGTIQYDGNSPRLSRADFSSLSTFGAVAGADVVDWPISYQDLELYYDATELVIGVQGLAGSDPFAEPRGPYPMPPGAPSKAGSMLAEAAKRLGYHPHPMPIAINSMPYRGRPACTNAGYCPFGCPVNAKSSTAVTVIREALLTGNLSLFTESCVTRVLTEPSGARATGVELIDPKGARATMSADHVVLALNAIETPRLLLDTRGPAHPDGLGNSSGLVGRYMMFHTIVGAVGIFDEEIRSYRGRVATHGFSDFTVSDGSEGFIRGGYVELGGQIRPVEAGSQFPWLLHKELITNGPYIRRIATAAIMGEDVPQLENRVELDPSLRDIYGRSAPRITYRRHEHDQAMIDRYLPKLEAVAREAGASDVIVDDGLKRDGYPTTRHLLGTTRMGTDASKSVTDPWGRLHDVENVWICDGGTWPTSASFNPTLTQQALAYRTAAYLADPGDPHP
ncbi:MAG: GMC family oxidoreductase [Deltaproteobacteria bacterium]|nr:GMC family oxidoreductase [Deltaproteobacteria bacterium]